jgi:GH15 family glucan-1,4-alpha-glucosidase
MSKPAPPGAPHDHSENRDYRPISDYGIIGDMHTAALIAADGSIDWACLPYFDSPAVFLRLLDRQRGGYCSVHVADLVSTSRRYREGTNILETTFTTRSGSFVLNDFMPIRSSRDAGEPYGQIIRLARCTAGHVDFGFHVRPTFAFAGEEPRIYAPAPGVVAFQGRNHALLLQASDIVIRDAGSAIATGRLEAGEWGYVALSCGGSRVPLDPPDLQNPLTALQETERYWVDWSGRLNYNGDYRDEVLRSILVLKLLTFSPTGAIVAAPTTSLPEVIGGRRNWDYRLSWIRDSQFVLTAFMHCGYSEEAHRFFRFLQDAAKGPVEQLQILYNIHGERAGQETELDYLEGYRGSRPVRVGNAAGRQNQSDIYGELLNCMYVYCHTADSEAEKRKRVAEIWPMAEPVADYVMRHWREPDQGIWESRGTARQYVHSKAMCWAALDRAMRLAPTTHAVGKTECWESARDAIMQSICSEGYDTKIGAFVQSYGSEVLDAAVLRLPLLGVIGAEDPRMRSSVEQLEGRILREGLLYRYGDGREEMQEGAFTSCTLWLINYYVLVGHIERAHELLVHLLTFQNEMGLFSEELNPRTGEQLGNFPQALTHVALISAIRYLEGGPRPGALHLIT